MPDSVSAHIIRGCLLAVMRRYRAASARFASALERDGGNQFARAALAAVSIKKSIF
jgi:hypothetical protein